MNITENRTLITTHNMITKVKKTINNNKIEEQEIIFVQKKHAISFHM